MTDSNTLTGPATEPETGNPPAPMHSWRLLAAGLPLALLLGWTLLSWALSLLFMLGLFFFMLFGLLIGALIYRVGAQARPLPRRRVVMVTAIVSLTAWSVALIKEGIDFPRDFVEHNCKPRKIYISTEPGAFVQAQAQMHTFITEYLRRHYPPGGALGYLQLASRGDVITMDLPDQPRVYRVGPRVPVWVWWTRGLLAIVLMYFAMFSVTGDLAKPVVAS